MGKNKLVENGFVLLKEDTSFLSPVSMIFFEYYHDLCDVEDHLSGYCDLIQTVGSRGRTPFGQAQDPDLWNYADGLDTIEFLKDL